ncbi:MAG: glycoside hydrolase family 5 protein [Clostridiaceae bacterium]|nr:glycoside hydrolase family 5 protein [Clostridiaceae bacterium]
MDFLHINDEKIYAGTRPIMLRGIGLGGWFLPEGYMWQFYTDCDRPRRIEALIETLCGKEYAQSFWQRYAASFITSDDIAWIADQGLNSIRLPLNARHLFNVDENGHVTFNEDTLAWVDRCIDWCRRHRIYVFIDMHAAPGGQTGQNIDDSASDYPELFTEPQYADALIKMWYLIAERYTDEPVIGGYDLLNEPLPKWHRNLNHKLWPLYKKLIAAIRKIDKRHIIVLEGAHWATDMSVFDDITHDDVKDQILLSFHKYWSHPDQESIEHYKLTAARLKIPLWMGEGGENNLEWYTHLFPMLEYSDIGWCFWTYKKMETPNVPVTFPRPADWDKIIAHIKGHGLLTQQEAKKIMDDFLQCIATPTYHVNVINALLRRPSLKIPATAYNWEDIHIIRDRSVEHFRVSSHASLHFADGHTGEPDWRRYNGEAQPPDQKIRLHLFENDRVGYLVRTASREKLKIEVEKVETEGYGTLDVQVADLETANLPEHRLYPSNLPQDCCITLSCTKGDLLVDSITVCEEV